MALEPSSPTHANVSDSEHNTQSNTCYGTVTNVAFRRVCLIVCVNLGPKAVISRGEQNRYSWRRRTLLTARLIKLYGGLRLMKSTAA